MYARVCEFMCTLNIPMAMRQTYSNTFLFIWYAIYLLLIYKVHSKKETKNLFDKRSCCESEVLKIPFSAFLLAY